MQNQLKRVSEMRRECNRDFVSVSPSPAALVNSHGQLVVVVITSGFYTQHRLY